jgi:hypothetical protein
MSTIGDLCVATSVNSDDKLPVWQTCNGVTRALPISVLDSRYLTQADIASLAASAKVETFSAGVDFTPGVSLALTLANQYFSAANIEVFFDASFQGPDQYSLAGYGLVFTSPIPVGVQKVYVRGGAIRVIGAPSDGTVTDGSVASGSKLSNRLNDVVYATDFGADPTGTNSCVSSINNAIAHCAAIGGGCVELGTGVFLIDASIIMDATVSVVGKGQYATRLAAKAGFSGSMVKLINDQGQGIRFGALSLIGNGSCNGFETGSATEMAQHVTFFDMLVFGFVNGFINSSNYGYYDSSLERIDFQNCTGVACDVGGSQSVLNRCTFGNNATALSISEQSAGSIGGPKLIGCTWAANAKDVVFVGAIIRPTLFSGCWFETASFGVILSTVVGQTLFHSLVFDGCLFQPGATAGGTGVFLPNSFAGTVAFRNCVIFNDLNSNARLPSVVTDAGVMANGQWTKTGCYRLNGATITIEPDENNSSIFVLNAINSLRRYANDAAAGAGGLPSGAIYFNTTIGALSLKT